MKRPVESMTEAKASPALAEWAKGIKEQIELEFDAVAACLRTIAVRQQERDRAHTNAILRILEDKRAEVMGSAESPEFVFGWHDIGEQVRRLVFEDARYKAIRLTRTTPRRRLRRAARTVGPLHQAN